MWFTFITARLFHLPQLPTPPHGDAVEVVFRREQPNSTGGTCTHVQASFPGAGFVPFCKTNVSTVHHPKHSMFTGVLTGTSTSSRLVHGLLLIDKLKSLSIFANSFSATPIPSPGIKGFTGLISISYNKTKGVHGFTGPAQ